MLTDKEQSKDKTSFIIVCLRNIFFPHLLFLFLFFVLGKEKKYITFKRADTKNNIFFYILNRTNIYMFCHIRSCHIK